MYHSIVTVYWVCCDKPALPVQDTVLRLITDFSISATSDRCINSIRKTLCRERCMCGIYGFLFCIFIFCVLANYTNLHDNGCVMNLLGLTLFVSFLNPNLKEIKRLENISSGRCTHIQQKDKPVLVSAKTERCFTSCRSFLLITMLCCNIYNCYF